MVGIPQGMKDQELRAIRATHRADPPAERELVGLAFSGGGIRSATFGLGVLQALKEVDLLGRIHYLSTVSGGGYIGAWFSANCRRARQRGDWPWSSPKADWDASIRHLRRYSNYLSPDVGFFSADTWSMFTVWLRNAMLVQWTVVMAVACVLLVPRLLIPLFAHWYDYGDWLTEKGWFVTGDALQPTSTATSVRMADGKPVVTDGPFAETKEQLGGYYILDVANLDEAIEAGARCPGAMYGTIELRPIQDFPEQPQG